MSALENIMLSEISHVWSDKYYIISITCRVGRNSNHKIQRTVVTGSGMWVGWIDVKPKGKNLVVK